MSTQVKEIKDEQTKENFDRAMKEQFINLFNKFKEEATLAPTKLTKLQEVYDSEGMIKESPTIFPFGEIDFDYGEVLNIDEKLAKELQRSFDLNVYGQKIPITLDHRDGEAYGWVKAVFIEDQQVKINVEWLEDGEILLKKKKYAYFSPEIWTNYKIKGQVFPIILRAVSLTNFPRIKVFNNVLEGFSEMANYKEKEQEEDVPTFNDLLSQLKDISKKLSKHPDLFRKTGAPKVKSAFNLILDSLKKYEKKEEKSMEKETKNSVEPKEEVMQKEENTVKIDFKEEIQKELLKMKEEIEAKHKQELSEMKKAMEEQAVKKAELAEAKISLLEEANKDKEDLMFFNELVAKEIKVLADREDVMRKLKASRKSGVIKLSETEEYNHYEEMKKDLLNSPKKIDYSEKGNPGNAPDNAVIGAFEKTKALAEEKMKAGKSRVKAYSEASLETGYKTMQSDRSRMSNSPIVYRD